MLSLCCAAKMNETHNVMSRMCADATVFLLFSLDQTVVPKMHFLSTSRNFQFAYRYSTVYVQCFTKRKGILIRYQYSY